MKRGLKIFAGFYFGTILFAASPIFALALFGYLWIRAQRRRKFYRKFTGPAVPGSERWDRRVTASAG